jgi:hypothetical protein
MPTFSSGLHALDPYGHPDSELEEDVNLIGWSQDIDGNGELDILWEGINDAAYNTGLSSQPQIAIDDMNKIYVLYSSVTEGFDNGASSYRHIWARTSPDNGTTWGTFHDMNTDLIYIFDECVYPSIAANTDDNIYYSYQADDVPGPSTNGLSSTENHIRVVKVLKSDIVGVEETNEAINTSNVSQNYPNPFNGTSTVYVNLTESASLSLEVHNMMGQLVSIVAERNYPAGRQQLTIDAQNLDSGVYFYTVISGETKITKKMIVE